MLYCLAIIVLAVFVWCLHTRYSNAGRLIAVIPGTRDIPFIGNAHPLAMMPTDKLFLLLRDIYKTFGGITKFYSFHIRAVNIYEPEDVEVILSSTRFNDRQVPYSFLKPWLGEGLLLSNGNKWHHRRKMLTPAFHFHVIKKYAQIIIEHTEDLILRVKEETSKEKTELLPLMTTATLNIIADTAMGTSMRKDSDVMNSYIEAVQIVGHCVIKRLCRVWYFMDAIYYLSEIGKTQTKALKALHSLTDKIIQERKATFNYDDALEFTEDNEIYGKKKRLAMLDLLLQNEKDGKIDLKGIREEVNTFMFGGSDTTSAALSFMIMRIANEPEIQEKIYEEMWKIFGNTQRLPTMEDFSEMKYLECCIKESLRIYPSAPFISRHLAEDTVLSGYKVPAKTAVNIHIYDIHHRADIYPDPEKFIPERFLHENILKRHPYAYLPFSAGSRNCIGQKFALIEMKAIVSGLLRRFRLEAVTKPRDVKFVVDLILRSQNPIYVRFRERN